MAVARGYLAQHRPSLFGWLVRGCVVSAPPKLGTYKASDTGSDNSLIWAFMGIVLVFLVVGFATSYTFAFPLRLEAVGIWIGFTVGLGVYALLLVWRFNLLTLRGYMPATPGHAATH